MKSLLLSTTLIVLFFFSNISAQTLKMTSGTNYVNIGDLDITGNQITVECLVKYTGGVNIVSKHTAPGNLNYLLRIGTFEISTGTNTNYTFHLMTNPFAGNMVTGRWYHIAGTYDGATIKYYVNGCLVISQAATGNLLQSNLDTGIGNRTTTPTEQFYGEIDELKIWSVARTEAEIKANMFDLPNPTTQNGLRAYYKFDNNLINLQGNTAFNGTWVGTAQYGTPEPTINDIQLLNINSLSKTDLTCYNSANGQITINATGTNLNYSIDGTNWSATNPITNLAANLYTVRARTAEGCIVTDTIRVRQPEQLIVTASNNGPKCIGDTIQIIATTSNQNVTYNWTGPNSFTGTASQENVTTAGTYNVTISKNGCTSTAASTNVTFNPKPIFTKTIDSISCYGLNNGKITINSSNIGNEYSKDSISWSNTNIFDNLTPGNHTIYVRSAQGCVAKDTFTLFQPEQLSVTASNNGPSCQGNPVQISATSNNQNITYTWTGPSNFTSNSITNTVTNAGTYNVTISKNGCTSSSSSTEVVLNGLPSFSLLKTNETCTGARNGSISITSNTASLEYSIDNTNWTSATTFNQLTAGNYTVYARTANGCNSQENITIEISETLVVNATNTGIVCLGNSITIEANTSNTGVTYSWTGPNNFQTSNQSESVNTAGIYTVVISKLGCTSQPSSTTVNFYNVPTISTNVTQITCSNAQDGKLEISSNLSGTTFNTSPGNFTGSIIENLAPGTYQITATSIDGCTATSSVSFTNPVDFDWTANVTPSTCFSPSGKATIIPNVNANLTIQWSDNNPSGFTRENMATGNYNFIISNGQGCNINGQISIEFDHQLNLNINPTSANIIEGDSKQLNVSFSPYIPQSTYEWIPNYNISCLNCPNPIVSPSVDTTYYVIVKTPDGCIDTSAVRIKVDQNCGEIFIPNMFSPNGDGENDFFTPNGKCINKYILKIYNRWGELIFEGDNGWDGYIRGKIANSGVYIYKLNMTLFNQQNIESTGSITLVH